MLTIRLQRVGRKHDPVFRVVVTDSKTGPKSNKHKEIIGSYDARRDTRAIIDAERATYWLSQGAQPSDTVRNALVDLKVIAGKKVNALPKKSPIVDEEALAAAKEAEEAAKAKAAEEKLAAEEAAKAEAEAPATEEKEETPVEEKTEEAPVVEESAEAEAPAEAEVEEKTEAPTEEAPATEEEAEEKATA